MAEAREEFGPGYHPPSPRKLRNLDPRICVPLDGSPPPALHSDDPEQRAKFFEGRRHFRDTYQVAHHELKASLREGRPFRGKFPPGCIRPTDRLCD